jgi:hypothetical protein
MALFTTTFPNTVRTITGNAVAFADDVVLLCDTSVSAVTLTLQEIPTGNWNLLWKLFVIDSGNNASVNSITINAPSGQTINLGGSIVINTNGGGYVFEISGNGQYLGTPSSGGGGGGGGVTSVGATSPLTSSGGATPNISIPQATALLNGYLSSTDWNAFNSKGSPLAIINNVGGTVTTSATSIRFDTNLTTSNVGGAVTVSAAGASSGVFQHEIHVSQVDGNDTTGNGTLLNPVASITYALTLLTGSRKTIVVHPGTYSENVTVANTNTTIATTELTGANTQLSGTLTIGTAGSGSRISGLKMNNLVISGTAQAYISNCTVDTQVTKSSSGYVEIINTEMQCTLGIQISGSNITIINGNKNVGVAVSNASAQVIIKGCNSVVTPSASAGNLAIVDCIVTALGGNGITITNPSTTLTLLNSQVLVTAGNNVAPISVAGIYTIINTVYDKPTSTFTGTSTNSIDYFQYINADKFIKQGGTASQFLKADGSVDSNIYGAPFDVQKTNADIVTSVTKINFNTDFNVTASVTPNKVNIAISSGTWTDLVGFEHQKTITSVQFPQCRVIGNLLYFRGTAIVPLASDLAGTTYVAPSSTTLIYASNPHPFVFQGSSGLIKGCLIAGILNKSIEFNLGGSVIPPSISYTIGSPTNTGWRIYNRGIETIPTRGSLLSTIGKVELDNGGILRYLPYNYAEVTWTSDPSCIGNGRLFTADVDAGNGALDWMVVNATLSPGASTTHSSNPGFTSFWDASYPVRSASYIFPFSAETAIAENMGGFMIELDGLIGFPP